jgi:hypothetical protein
MPSPSSSASECSIAAAAVAVTTILILISCFTPCSIIYRLLLLLSSIDLNLTSCALLFQSFYFFTENSVFHSHYQSILHPSSRGYQDIRCTLKKQSLPLLVLSLLSKSLPLFLFFISCLLVCSSYEFLFLSFSFLYSSSPTIPRSILLFQGLNSKLELMVSEMKARSPRDADEWINSFVAVADRFPACIVITDMTIAGGPMVFVNRGEVTPLVAAQKPYPVLPYLDLHSAMK